MQSIFGNSRTLKIVLPVACFLVSVSAWCQVAPRSGDVSYSAGYNHVGTGPNSDFAQSSGNSFTTGGSGGFNVSQWIEAGGEFNFFNDPMPNVSPGSLTYRILNYGGLVRFNLAPKSKVVPYGVFGIGGSHASQTASLGGNSVSISESGYYLGGGGGASIYLGSNWGVRAEFRDDWNHFTYRSSPNSTDILSMTGGIFYQFAGVPKKVTQY